LLRIADEVRETLQAGGPVVALETTIVAHGFPPGEGLEVGRVCEGRVREGGAVPATIALIDGEFVVGLSDAELERVAMGDPKLEKVPPGPEWVLKVGPRDIGQCLSSFMLGATTVGGTLVACRHAGIRFLATGGLGGVHRGWTERPDVSADLGALARTPTMVVCSGIKSLLDVPATMEVLETLGVPVYGYGTNELPLFYTRGGGPEVPVLETVKETVALARAHWEFSDSAIVVARPPEESLDDVEPLIESALAEAETRGVTGQAVTPFVLAYLHEHSEGRTLAVNRRLAADNAWQAASFAVAFSPAA